jgi:hypothetical protein
MANPTTNFGWVMPTSSSLVTNLPADFNTFGQAVDTSMSELLGGTTGQVLSKTSNTNMDFTWVTPTDQTPLTTKGDLFAFSTVDARLPAGANETRLVADSAQTLGLKYVADTTNYAIAAKGDLLAGTAADTLQALTVGTNGQVLQADSTAATGLKWATASSGGLTVIDTSTVANTSTTLTISSIPATYKHLLIVGVGLQTSGANDGDLFVRVNGDSGNNYTLERITVSGSTLSGYGTGSISGISNLGAMARTADGATLLGQVAVYIYNYSSSADYKTIVTSGGSMNNSTNSWVASRGMWRNTAAVTSVSLVDANGTNLKAGTYITYGWS